MCCVASLWPHVSHRLCWPSKPPTQLTTLLLPFSLLFPVDLDEAYGTMSSANYADLVSQAPQRRPAASASATEGALLGERDAVMLSALHTAAMQRCGGVRKMGRFGVRARRVWKRLQGGVQSRHVECSANKISPSVNRGAP